ncbi:MAG: hypothetical protein ACXWZ2_14545 [Mycobacterium sp.]
MAKIADRIGKMTSDRSFFNTAQLCFVSAQPREMAPVVPPESVARIVGTDRGAVQRNGLD